MLWCGGKCEWLKNQAALRDFVLGGTPHDATWGYCCSTSLPVADLETLGNCALVSCLPAAIRFPPANGSRACLLSSSSATNDGQRGRDRLWAFVRALTNDNELMGLHTTFQRRVVTSSALFLDHFTRFLGPVATHGHTTKRNNAMGNPMPRAVVGNLRAVARLVRIFVICMLDLWPHYVMFGV